MLSSNVGFSTKKSFRVYVENKSYYKELLKQNNSNNILKLNKINNWAII